MSREVPEQPSIISNYMVSQPYIDESMRSALVDWLIEVHWTFQLVPETLYLTVKLIERYLERKEVARNKLQLVGVTSLLVASKYEDSKPPYLCDLVTICKKKYSSDQIIEMKNDTTKTLEYKVAVQESASTFLNRLLNATHVDKRVVQLSCIILDGTLQSYKLASYRPSQLAAAAV